MWRLEDDFFERLISNTKMSEVGLSRQMIDTFVKFNWLHCIGEFCVADRYVANGR